MQINSTIKRISIFTTLLLTTQLSFAQNKETSKDSIANLQEVTVATRNVAKVTDIPGTVWVLSEKQIQEQVKNGVPLKEMLGILIPGMDVGSQGRSNYGQNIRGRNALILIDGVSINSLRTISRQLDAIDPFNIARIEVLSGASSVYGGDATGGIINIITKRATRNGFGATTEMGGRSGLRNSNDHDLRIAQSVQGRGEKLEGRASIAYQQNGAAYGANNQQIYTDITQTDLQYNRTIDVMGSGSYKINKDHVIFASAQYYNSKNNGDRSLYLGDSLNAYLKANGSLLAMKDGFNSDIVPRTQRWMANLTYTGKNILGGQTLYFQGAYRGERLDFYPFPGNTFLATGSSPFMSASRQNTNYGGLKLVLSKNWQQFSLVYGVDADYESFWGKQGLFDISQSLNSGGLVNKLYKTVNRYPHVGSISYSGYVQGTYRILPYLQLDGGLRYQTSKIHVDDFTAYQPQAYIAYGKGKSADAMPGGTKSYNMAVANGKLLFKPSVNDQAWFAFSQGVSLVDPAKFFGSGTYAFNATTDNWDLKNYFSIQNANLQAIKTNMYELGYRTRHSGFSGQVSGFISQSNKDRRSDAKTYQIVVFNNKVRNLGLEGEANYQYKNWEFGTGGLWILTQTRTDSTNWRKQNIAYASQSKLVSHIGYSIDKWNFRFQNTNNFDMKDDDKNSFHGYNISDLFIGYKLPLGKLNVGIQNLLNRTYQTTWSQRAQVFYASYKLPDMFYYQGRGRTFSVNYTIDF